MGIPAQRAEGLRAANLWAVQARVFVIFATGYFLSYLYRTVNAVLAPDLTRDLALSPADLGLLTAAYFMTFALFQVPLGVLLDKYGPRRVESLLLVLAALGAAGFALADTVPMLILARALIGLGVSACLMAGFKALVQWFPREKLPLWNSVYMVAGGLGAVTAAAPVELALQVTDWRGVFLALAGLTLLAALAIALFVPTPPTDPHAAPAGDSVLAGLKAIYGSALFWRIAPMAAACQGTYLAYQSLWIGPWVRDVQGLERAAAASVVTAAAFGMAGGYLLLGLIAEAARRRGIGPLTVARIGMSLFVLVQISLLLAAPLPPALSWMLFGGIGSASMLCYAYLSQSMPPHLAGRVNTAVNMLCFVQAFIVQTGIGELVNHLGAPGHAVGLGLCITLEIAALTWGLLRPNRR